MDAIVPYLTFNGDAKEAMDFYADALGGKIEMIQTFGEMAKDPGYADKVMHATLKAGELTLMASDVQPGMKVGNGDMISLSLNFTDKGELEKVFNKLAAGGKVTMPLQDTFWGAHFGMLDDKFGNSWMVNHDYSDKQERQDAAKSGS